MKHARKLASLLLALVMVFALATTAFAQDVQGTGGTGSITISNAAKGETYTIYKLFDATVHVGADVTSIAYTGTVPTGLETYFSADENNYISATPDATDGANMSDGLKAALKTWTENATETAHAESDGTTLNFKGLAYGYYVVTTTQGTQVISVDSTMPDVTIFDKNSATPTNLNKKADVNDVSIGDTVTYTVSFKTSNYYGAGTEAKEILSYTIEDTLPEFLKDVKVTSIRVNNDVIQDQTGATPQFDSNKKIVIKWYDEVNKQFLYDNGATVTITYTAKVTDKAVIDGNGNTNDVTLKWTTKDSDQPVPSEIKEKETIYTYAIALKKVNDKGQALPGAIFEFPFYVKSTADADGAYIYAGTEAGENLTKQITTPADGVIIVKGVKTDSYTITEFKAPDGYNKLADPVTVTAVRTGSTTTSKTVYLDENGKETNETTAIEVKVENNDIAATAVVVVNKAGTELPSTGGMGTTLFYVLGAVLVVGAGVLLITKKRMSDANR